MNKLYQALIFQKKYLKLDKYYKISLMYKFMDKKIPFWLRCSLKYSLLGV